MPDVRDVRGQATVELVALLPLLVVLAAGAWQVAVAGHAVWASGVSARAAARAAAVGADAAGAAVRPLPTSLRAGARVRRLRGGAVRVTVAIPSVVGRRDLATVSSTARFEPQR